MNWTRTKTTIAAIATVLWTAFSAYGQSAQPVIPLQAGSPVGSANPLYIQGTLSASLGGFTPSASGARMTQLSVTTSDSSGTLPTGTVVVVSNTGANPMFCNVNGVAATTSDQPITAGGGWFAFTIPASVTTLHCIATGGSTTADGVGGSGLATGTGGGGGGATAVIDTNNSSTATLSGGAAFTGTATNVSGYSYVNVLVYADQNSAATATTGVAIEFSSDGTNWDDSFVGSFTAGSSAPNAGQTYGSGVRAKYMRVVYTNGSSAQGTFRLSTLLQPTFPGADTTDLSLALTANSHGLVTKSVISAKAGSNYVDLVANGNNHLYVGAASGDFVDGAITTLGTEADAAWSSGSGTVIGLLKNIAGSGTTTASAVQGPIPGGTAYIGHTSQDPCAYNTKKSVSFSTGSDGALLAAGTSSTNTYICSLSVIASAAANFGIGAGSGSSVCTSGTPYALIGSTTASSGLSFAANGGLTLGNGSGTVMSDVAAVAQGYNICIRINGTANLAGSMTYVQM